MKLEQTCNKNYPRYTEGRMAGRLKRISQDRKLEDQDFEPAYEFKNTLGLDIDDPSNFVGVDPGHNTVVCAVSPVPGEVMHDNGTLEMEVRAVSKGCYNVKSGRQIVTNRQKKLSRNDHIQAFAPFG